MSESIEERQARYDALVEQYDSAMAEDNEEESMRLAYILDEMDGKRAGCR